MQKPKTKESELIAKLNALGDKPDEFSVRKVEREIEASKAAVGTGTYYVFRGMLATICKKFDEAISFHEAALKLTPTQWAYGAYAASLSRLGFMYRSMEMYEKSYAIDKSDTEYLVSLTNAQVRNSLYDRAAEVLETLDEDTLKALHIDKQHVEYLHSLIKGENISEDEIIFIIKAAEDVLFRRKIILESRGMIFADTDEQFLIFDAVAPSLSDSEILEANIEICDLLAEREPPEKFTGKSIFRVSASN